MTLLEKQKQFKVELSTLLSKYKAEMTLEDFGSNYMRDEKMVVTFGYDETLVEENGSGIIPDLVLGTFVS
tara:strand:- start:465 stop:674 length:210 start_codon:yes stop_codon:yes gene_type:complete